MFPHRNKLITNLFAMDKQINDLPICKKWNPFPTKPIMVVLLEMLSIPRKPITGLLYVWIFFMLHWFEFSLPGIKSMELLENIRISVFQPMQNFVHSIIMSLIITGTQVPGTASTIDIWL